ncbi:hypothetical protein HK101_000181, partial [Irineochytrium annulatum]
MKLGLRLKEKHLSYLAIAQVLLVDSHNEDDIHGTCYKSFMAALRQYHLALYLIGNVRLTEDIFQAYGAGKHECPCVGGDTPNGLNSLAWKQHAFIMRACRVNAFKTIDSYMSAKRLAATGDYGSSFIDDVYFDVTKGGVFAETGIFVAQCRHEVVRFAADHTKGESYNYANTMIRLTSEKDSRKLEVGYDIICLLTTHRDLNNVPTPYINYIPVMHSYVHDTKCQAKFGPRSIMGLGTKCDGEGHERNFGILTKGISLNALQPELARVAMPTYTAVIQQNREERSRAAAASEERNQAAKEAPDLSLHTLKNDIMIKAAKVKSIGRIIKQAHGTRMTNSLKKMVVNQARQLKLMIDDYNDVLLGENSAGKASEDDPDDEEDLGDETVDD